MIGLSKLLLTFAALIAAGIGIFYVWTGFIPPSTLKIAQTFGIFAVLCVAVQLISYSPSQRNET